MSPSRHEERFPDDLQEVADQLRGQRPALGPLELDRVKLRAMSGTRRSAPSRNGGAFMRSRLTALVTVAFLAVGTGGALAMWGGGGLGFGGVHAGSASFHQYRPCEEELSGYGGRCVPHPTRHCRRGYKLSDGHCVRIHRKGEGNRGVKRANKGVSKVAGGKGGRR